MGRELPYAGEMARMILKDHMGLSSSRNFTALGDLALHSLVLFFCNIVDDSRIGLLQPPVKERS